MTNTHHTEYTSQYNIFHHANDSIKNGKKCCSL
uniref:Uncharacterized protein n=1 Tax=Rhizophora mucronata TaxID=61149 RepID=A0A2P2QK23_RHIMU